jgi:hypothetical protein
MVWCILLHEREREKREREKREERREKRKSETFGRKSLFRDDRPVYTYGKKDFDRISLWEGELPHQESEHAHAHHDEANQ